MPASAALTTRYISIIPPFPPNNAKWAAKFDVGLTVHLIKTIVSESAVI
jgi:hypothetical protein